MVIKQLLIAIDQVFNVLLYIPSDGFGYADETLSARIWRNQNKNRFYKVALVVVNGLFFWQANHCRGAYFAELMRKHLPREYRNNQQK
jgi:hypothetical protein